MSRETWDVKNSGTDKIFMMNEMIMIHIHLSKYFELSVIDKLY